jgi:hypothetical protein
MLLNLAYELYLGRSMGDSKALTASALLGEVRGMHCNKGLVKTHKHPTILISVSGLSHIHCVSC